MTKWNEYHKSMKRRKDDLDQLKKIAEWNQYADRDVWQTPDCFLDGPHRSRAKMSAESISILIIAVISFAAGVISTFLFFK